MSADTKKISKTGYVIRGIVSIIAIFIYGWLNFSLDKINTPAVCQAVSEYFKISDLACFDARFFGNLALSALFITVSMMWIWWKSINRFLNHAAQFTNVDVPTTLSAKK